MVQTIKRRGKNAYKADLENISDVRTIKQSTQKLKFVHVAGTNRRKRLQRGASANKLDIKLDFSPPLTYLILEKELELMAVKYQRNVIDFCNKTQGLRCKPLFEITFALWLWGILKMKNVISALLKLALEEIGYHKHYYTNTNNH